MQTWLHALACILLAALSSKEATAGKQVALVIGNSAYEYANRLPNAANDATDVAHALRGLGYVVTESVDATRKGMLEALQNFRGTTSRADIGLIYFAGQGFESDGINYVIPIDARIERRADIDYNAIAVRELLSSMEDVRGLRMVVIDGCRNTLFYTGSRGVRGFRPIDNLGGNTLVLYSTMPGGVARDGEGRNSPFAEAFLRALKDPNLSLLGFLVRVEGDVRRNTDGEQSPTSTSTAPVESFYLGRSEQNLPTASANTDAALKLTGRIALVIGNHSYAFSLAYRPGAVRNSAIPIA